MADQKIASLDAGGQLTDSVLARLGELPHISQLNFGGTKHVTDEGLAHLARLQQLQELDLSDYPGGQITDRGLAVLRHLPELRRLQMCWQSAITDAGVANLRFCEKLESVDLLGHAHGRRRHRRSRRQRRAPSSQDRTPRDRCGAAAAASAPDLQNLARRYCQILADEPGRRAEPSAARWSVHERWPRDAERARRALWPHLLLAHLGADACRSRATRRPAEPRVSRVSGPTVRRRSHASYRCNPSPSHAHGAGHRRH